jgi:eukaryotic-like serine/threonine-protein kinase
MAVSDDVQHSPAASATAFPDAPGHYAFRALLGEGGHGQVYEAWDSRLQRAVAIKRVRQEAVAGGADLVREARMAASLHHPAFVKVHAVEEAGGSQFIVMELVPGRTLKQVLADGAPDPATALDWVSQVADAMRHAHASGLVHGDLKPSNLIVEPGGKVRILDFGLALRQDVLATTTVTESGPQGTIAYMAPERLLGAPPDRRGDVYSLGVMLYELLVGRRPFAMLKGLALAAAQVQSSSDSWEYPDTLDTPLIALVRAMTARQPEHRVPTMDELASRLAALPGAGTDAAAGAHATESGSTPRRHAAHRLRWVGGSVLVLAFVGAGAWWQSGAGSDSVRRVLAPYSEAGAMKDGLAALKAYDRPGELERAQAHFQRVLDRSPDNAAAVAGMSLAHSLRYTNDSMDEIWLQKADAGAQLALKLNDQLALSHIATGAVRNSQGQFDKAVAAYEQALRLDPENYFAWYGKVESLRNARQYPQTLAALTEAMRRFPGEAVFVGELGVLRFEQNDYPAAEQAFRQAIRMQPDNVTAYANLNGILLVQNRNDEALRVLQQGLQIRPSAVLYSNLGSALFFRGDYVGAAAAYENAVSPTRGGSGNYLYWANLGDALLWLPGRERQAMHAYDRARQLLEPQLARSPDDTASVSRMSLYSARVGDAPRAIALASHALGLAPRDPMVQFRAGLAYELLGKRALALDAINAARRLGYPDNLVDAEPGLLALRRDPGYRAR